MISDKLGVQDLLSLFKQKNIHKIIIAPGSRNAPLTLSFTQDDYFTCFSIPDERSAAFFALGMAQHDQHPVVVICTSGSALLNFYPAVAEAYYQKIPLVVISADRPHEWIDQADGQTIRQVGALDKHVKYSVNLLQEASEKKDRLFNQRQINEALNHATHGRVGPVHINYPFEEPLYGQVEKSNEKAKNIRIANISNQLSKETLKEFADVWNTSSKRMILCGVMSPSEKLNNQLNELSKQAVIFTETTSNVVGEYIFPCIDRVVKSLDKSEEASIQPDVLITIGGPVISKQIKFLLREHSPTHHWHIDPDDWHLDTYQCLTDSIPMMPADFFEQILPLIERETQNSYFQHWYEKALLKRKKHTTYTDQMPWSDHKAFKKIYQHIPANYTIHLANSSPVRYAQLYEWKNGNAFYCNRGTSGIDGSTSTASGYAIASQQPTCIVTGDVSFLYDSNAFWNHHVPANLKVIVINNSGGGIFRIIPGPGTTPALSTYFETNHNFKGEGIASTFNLDYTSVDTEEELESVLTDFFTKESDKASILEINTPRLENSAILKEYFSALKA